MMLGGRVVEKKNYVDILPSLSPPSLPFPPPLLPTPSPPLPFPSPSPKITRFYAHTGAREEIFWMQSRKLMALFLRHLAMV